MRLVFMGTPDFSVVALKALIDAGHEIACVYSQPPRPAKRGQKERPSPVHALAEAEGLLVRTPLNFKDEADREAFAALNADVAVVVAYGLILPQAILDAPKHGCLNIHASLLPRWRGAAPIHRAIEAGDAETGVGIMQMEAGLDTGPVLLKGRLSIGETETTGELHDRLATLGGSLIVEALGRLPELKSQPQPDEGVTYAHKIDKAETRIDWSEPAETIKRKINAFSPFPGAWFELNGERVKVLRAGLAKGSGQSGEVLEGLTVACGEGAVVLLDVQKAGKKPASAEDFLRGSPIEPGTILD